MPGVGVKVERKTKKQNKKLKKQKQNPQRKLKTPKTHKPEALPAHTLSLPPGQSSRPTVHGGFPAPGRTGASDWSTGCCVCTDKQGHPRDGAQHHHDRVPVFQGKHPQTQNRLLRSLHQIM